MGDGKFEQAKLVTPKPSFVGLGGQLQLADLDADGGKQLVSFAAVNLKDILNWMMIMNGRACVPSKPFLILILVMPISRMLDLNGDGKPEVVISEEQVFTWYASEGRDGFTSAKKTLKPFDEEAGPHIVFADAKQTIFLADMSGDGMADIVTDPQWQIVCYWPNLGYGKFGCESSFG